MAVILGQYIVSDKNTNLSDYAIGLSLPVQIGTNSFLQTYDNLSALKASVTNLLRTNQGERIGLPLFGTRLRSILFEPNDEGLEDKIFDAIDTAVRFWIPQLQIQSIEVSNTNEQRDRNEVTVSIVFNAPFMNSSFVVNLNFTNNS